MRAATPLRQVSPGVGVTELRPGWMKRGTRGPRPRACPHPCPWLLLPSRCLALSALRFLGPRAWLATSGPDRPGRVGTRSWGPRPEQPQQQPSGAVSLQRSGRWAWAPLTIAGATPGAGGCNQVPPQRGWFYSLRGEAQLRGAPSLLAPRRPLIPSSALWGVRCVPRAFWAPPLYLATCPSRVRGTGQRLFGNYLVQRLQRKTDLGPWRWTAGSNPVALGDHQKLEMVNVSLQPSCHCFVGHRATVSPLGVVWRGQAQRPGPAVDVALVLEISPHPGDPSVAPHRPLSSLPLCFAWFQLERGLCGV